MRIAAVLVSFALFAPGLIAAGQKDPSTTATPAAKEVPARRPVAKRAAAKVAPALNLPKVEVYKEAT